ncbi:hypothetical protein F2Q69_00059804 [Brassica cretica]|uniref:Uncharacterized protein n=1 Tax=Brassica cretica TaxID=69181 RepID=A0A8S9RMQ9_BRACR|nr:hypothetical protein F2Q69_00059804 [Brassica cretica]
MTLVTLTIVAERFEEWIIGLQLSLAVVDSRANARDTERIYKPQERSFHQRVDRHGRPFGNRVSTAGLRPTGPKNKIAPAVHHSQQTTERGLPQRQSDQEEQTYHSPPYSRRRPNNHRENRDTNHRSPTLQWRAKSPVSNQEVIHQQRQSCSPRPSLGRNLNITDFPTLIATHAEENLNNVTTHRSPRPQGRARPTIPDQEATSRQRLNHSPRAGEEANLGMDVLPQPRGLPTLELVMEELNESTLQYMNVDDPVERAARQKRVLQTEIDGTVEETTARILRNSTANVLPAADLAPPHTTDSTPQASPLDTGTAKTARRRGRPARTNISRTTIRLSPKTYAGVGSRKRKLAHYITPNKQQSRDYRSDNQTRKNRPTTRHHTPDVDPTITERIETQTIDRQHYNGEINLLSQIRKSFISKDNRAPLDHLWGET